MRPLLTIAAVGALAGVIVRRRRKAKAKRRHLHFEVWDRIPPGLSPVINRTGRSEYAFDTERWDRLNRTIHGGDV